MFENYTYEYLLNEMLERVDVGFDKRQGAVIYDALAPIAAELAQAYIQMDVVLDEVFADTQTREYLIRRAAERGLVPKSATYSVVKAVVTPETIELKEGDRFNLGDYNYAVYEKMDKGIYKMICETAGAETNYNTGFATPISYIDGLKTVEIVEVLNYGEDEEDTEVFRQRYFENIRGQAFGGNVADYRQKVKAMNGVGGVKVYRAEEWNGAGTVKLVIQGSDYDKPSSSLIEELQTAIDPTMNSGEGLGLAPIGHRVTVVGVDYEAVEISAIVQYADGYSFNDVKEQIKKVLIEYFEELNKNWENEKTIIIHNLQIGARLLNIQGIVDVTDIDITGEYNNYPLLKDDIIGIGGCSFNGMSLKED